MEELNVHSDDIVTEETSTQTNESNKPSISADLIRGHINTIILRTLYDSDKYGYEIMHDIEQKSHGQYELKQPTLYSALKRLESQGYIKAYWKTDEVSSGGRRKYFTLTESGKKITEINQNEWEYSRTIIDNLISDKSFDFNNPAPNPVDFRILTQTTSRVSTPASTDFTHDREQQTTVDIDEKTENNLSEDDIQKRHENYLRLVSEPTTDKKDKENDNDNFIYILKPETERDYKNLINNIYNKTIRQDSVQSNTANPKPQQRYGQQQFIEAHQMASADGLVINSATDSEVANNSKVCITKYNLGKTLFICSIIVLIFTLLESLFCLFFRETLKIDVWYALIILSIGVVQCLICSTIWWSKKFDFIAKPTNNSYISTSIIISILAILIISVIALLNNVNFKSITDILTKLIIPYITVLIIPIYTTSFYFITKN